MMDVIAFARGVPAPDMLPLADLRDAARRAFDSDPVKLLSYGTGAGWEPLRQWLAARHDVEPERVVVTTGSLQGFSLLVQALAARASEQGRRARVIVEQPTYDRPLLLMRRLGIEIVPVPLDPDGVDVEAFERAAEAGADMAYLIPTFQNPSGATLSEARRNEVLRVAQDRDLLVLEDDPYGLLHFGSPAPSPLFARSSGAPVAFSGSFSKTIAPGLRVGWLVLPPDLAADVARLANDTYISASFLGQATAHEFLAAGAFERNVDRSRRLLATRCDVIVDALRAHLPGCRFSAPAGGYFIWVGLPDGLRADAVVGIAAGEGVSFVPGSSFGEGCDDHVRLAFSSPPLDRIEEGVQRLARACSASLATA